MVKEVQAWQADDGTVHASEWAAAQHDARKALGALEMFNPATINAMMSRYTELFDIMSALMNAAYPVKEVPAPKSDSCRPTISDPTCLERVELNV